MFTRRDGKPWEPTYLTAINSETCIGCGRCHKVCGRDVMNLQGMTEDGDLVPFDPEDDDGDDYDRLVMVMENPGNCIGCSACNRVCPKDCQSFTAASELDSAAA